MFSSVPGQIGIFDSGYGGLTIFDKIRAAMPGYDYIYLGDNARAPYGTRSFEVVYEFTLQAVTKLFEMGCHLILLKIVSPPYPESNTPIGPGVEGSFCFIQSF